MNVYGVTAHCRNRVRWRINQMNGIKIGLPWTYEFHPFVGWIELQVIVAMLLMSVLFIANTKNHQQLITSSPLNKPFSQKLFVLFGVIHIPALAAFCLLVYVTNNGFPAPLTQYEVFEPYVTILDCWELALSAFGFIFVVLMVVLVIKILVFKKTTLIPQIRTYCRCVCASAFGLLIPIWALPKQFVLWWLE